MTPIVRVAIGLGVSIGALFVVLLLIPTSQPAPAKAGAVVSIPIKEDLVQQGANFFSSKGCTACHAIASLGMAGGAAGPDLSRVLLGEVPSGTRPEANPIEKWYAENGLSKADANLEKAAKLIEEYFEEPPAYTPVMLSQIQRLKGASEGEEQWEKDVQALVELFKKAATSGGK